MTNMRIFLIGVSCVGKTAVGKELAALRGVPFFDLDHEIERFFNRPIATLQAEFLTMHSFREKAAQALKALLARDEARDCVIALPPSGLMGAYWRTVQRATGEIVVLTDRPENIVERITFYDDDSKPVEKVVSDREKRLYVRQIRGDMTYFKRSYEKADLSVDIAGLSPAEAAAAVEDALTRHCQTAAPKREMG